MGKGLCSGVVMLLALFLSTRTLEAQLPLDRAPARACMAFARAAAARLVPTLLHWNPGRLFTAFPFGPRAQDGGGGGSGDGGGSTDGGSSDGGSTDGSSSDSSSSTDDSGDAAAAAAAAAAAQDAPADPAALSDPTTDPATVAQNTQSRLLTRFSPKQRPIPAAARYHRRLIRREAGSAQVLRRPQRRLAPFLPTPAEPRPGQGLSISRLTR